MGYFHTNFFLSRKYTKFYTKNIHTETAYVLPVIVFLYIESSLGLGGSRIFLNHLPIGLHKQHIYVCVCQ